MLNPHCLLCLVFSPKLPFKSWIVTAEESCTSCRIGGSGVMGEVIRAMPERMHSFPQDTVPYWEWADIPAIHHSRTIIECPLVIHAFQESSMKPL